MRKTIKPIAFYLPQYHPIPENDFAYGRGFTEWTNVKKAKPLFEGHNQPRVPLNNNYYSLLDEKVMIKQAELANEYGIYGFCYYHYWFGNGKKLLQTPIEMMLSNPDVNIRFCLCWANENWTKRWDGGNNDIIVKQEYGNKDDMKEHVEYLCRFFDDPRYIRVGVAPLLLVYRPELIPNTEEYFADLRDFFSKAGYKDIFIAVQHPKYYLDGQNLDVFDYYVQYQPLMSFYDKYNLGRSVKKLMLSLGLNKMVDLIKKREFFNKKKKEVVFYDYDEIWQRILDYKVKDSKLIAGAFVDWDNTSRKKNGAVFIGAEPEKFENYMRRLVTKISDEYATELFFINAWNEWAEGCYLEPDEKNKHRYLEALRNALE